MCGISGWQIEPSLVDLFNPSADRLIERLSHRGPDATGQHHNAQQGLFLGHNRLSIIDLSELGNQPMVSEQGDVMVLNGEIYNYRELKQELTARGHSFTSKTDSEVLLKSFVEWGIDCLEKLRGMYAVAIWSEREQTLHLVRDPTGIKPLYYWQLPGDRGVVFASQVNAMLELPEFDKSVNRDALNQYLEFGYTFDHHQTIFNGVQKVPPGHRLEIRNHKVALLTPYYHPPATTKEPIDTQAAEDQLYQTLNNVVNEHLVADVPVGVLLSGGLDSSLLAAIASQHEKIHTFSMGFADGYLDERPFAKMVSDYIGSDHTEFLIQPSEIIDDLDQAVASYDDLFDDWGLMSTRVLYKKVREQGIKVALVGEGSDELFGGYDIFKNALGTLNGPSEWQIFQLYRKYAGRRYGRQYFKFRSIFKQHLKACNGDYFSAIRLFEAQNRMPNNYVMKVDKASMSVSVEARTPYLDSRIANVAYRLPISELLDHGQEKIILKSIARQHKLLPDEIIDRRKYGTAIAANWMTESASFREFAQENILAADSWVDELGLRRPMELFFFKHQVGFRFPRSISLFGNLAWRLLILSLWSKSLGVTR